MIDHAEWWSPQPSNRSLTTLLIPASTWPGAMAGSPLEHTNLHTISIRTGDTVELTGIYLSIYRPNLIPQRQFLDRHEEDHGGRIEQRMSIGSNPSFSNGSDCLMCTLRLEYSPLPWKLHMAACRNNSRAHVMGMSRYRIECDGKGYATSGRFVPFVPSSVRLLVCTVKRRTT